MRFLLGRAADALLNLCLVPPLRTVLLRMLGAKIGPDAVIHDVRLINFYRGSYRNLRLGREVFVGQECLFDLADRITVGSRVTFAPRVIVLTHLNVGYPDHPLQEFFPANTGEVHIGDGVFIGAASMIMGGVTIGPGTFVCAGAVVTDSVPGGVMVGGVPAKILRTLETGQ